MNDYPPLHSPVALKKYHNIFKKNKLKSITPIPVIPVSIAVSYFKKHPEVFNTYREKLEHFLKKHPNAQYFMLDGTHRSAGAMLSVKMIPTYLIKSDRDVNNLILLRKSRKLNIMGLRSNLSETVGILQEHYCKTKRFWTLYEKVSLMISSGDIDEKILKHYNKKRLIELISFGKEIISICLKNGVTPVLYGSYLFRHYTKNKLAVPHDIDFYIPDEFNDKIIAILKKKKVRYKYLKEWSCLMIYKNDLKVDLDGINFLYDGPRDFKSFNFDGLKIKCLSLNGLMHIYKKSITLSDEPKKYKAKYDALKKFQ
jgi:hypothetical protein